ncbi:MAG: hypothetical protein EOO77_05160 [Oxalobacteraceae bacterium]|nr:MAG: hypothetical protein EOO77_05160 [Oxalobacteraceae bacterium]
MESAYQKEGRAATVQIFGGDAKFNDDGNLSLTLTTERPVTSSAPKGTVVDQAWSHLEIGANTRRAGSFEYGDIMGFTDRDMEPAPLSDILKRSPVFQNAAAGRKARAREPDTKNES